MVADEADGERAGVEPRQLRQGRLAVEEPRVVAAGQLDARPVDAQLVALGGQRSVEAAPGRRAGHDLVGQFERPRHRQEVHATSLRYTKNTSLTRPPTAA